MAEKEYSERHVCNFDLPGGLNGINYPQKFVRAKNVNAPGPCNYAAEKVNAKKVMSETNKA